MGRPASAYPSVVYLRGDGNYTWHHTEVGKPIVNSLTLHKMIATHYPHLLRIHKSYAVDVSRIGRLIQTENNGFAVELHDGTRLSVSRRRLASVKLALRMARRVPSGNDIF